MTSRSIRLTLLVAAASLAGVGALASGPAASESPKKPEPQAATPAPAPKQATAIFAGGCFWSEEGLFDQVPGVISATSGYTGGTKADPSYEEVSSGTTGHAESVKVIYDPSKVTYSQLLELYWHNVDPLTPNAEFCDQGTQYRSAIFYVDEEQHRLAEESKRQLEASGRFKQPIVTQIVSASTFYPAEEYHQDFVQKNPIRYRAYRIGCGRDARLKELWGDEAPKH